jgi:hypothetical protein
MFSDASNDPGCYAKGRLQHMRYINSSGTLQNFDYLYDASGNRTQMTDITGTNTPIVWNYGYDWLDPLTGVSIVGSSLSVSYTYDNSDNRTSMTVNGTVYNYTNNELDQVCLNVNFPARWKKILATTSMARSRELSATTPATPPPTVGAASTKLYNLRRVQPPKKPTIMTLAELGWDATQMTPARPNTPIPTGPPRPNSDPLDMYHSSEVPRCSASNNEEMSTSTSRMAWVQ